MTTAGQRGEGEGGEVGGRAALAEFARGRVRHFLSATRDQLESVGADLNRTSLDECECEELREAIHRIVEAWDGGDLAGAVNHAASLLPDNYHPKDE